MRYVTSEESRILRLAIIASSSLIDDGAYNSVELTMPKGIYERDETTQRKIASMGGKAAAAKEALTCPRCGKVGKGNGMVGHIRLQLDCNVERLCAREGCGKVLKKDPRSNYCSISCHKLDLYKDPAKRQELGTIQEGVAARPETKAARSKAMKKNIEEGYAAFMTPGELEIKGYLEDWGFQHNKVTRGGRLQKIIRMDFYHPHFRINIELDGEAHASPEAKEWDAKRDQALADQGIKVIRISDKGITPEIVDEALRNSKLGVEYHMKEFNLWHRNLRTRQRP